MSYCEWSQNSGGKNSCVYGDILVEDDDDGIGGGIGDDDTVYDDDDWTTPSVGNTVSNCYILSLNYQACAAASNCEWVPSGQTATGNSLCRHSSLFAENCYVLSLNAPECLAATNCELVLDVNGNTLCQDADRDGAEEDDDGFDFDDDDDNSTDDILFPTPTIVDQVTVEDCFDPNLTKEECNNSINCVWAKAECQETSMPTEGSMTLMPSLDPSARVRFALG